MIKALIFDFDGIVLQSSEIKTVAFRRMFENEPVAVRDRMNAYHLKNMGFSRQRKFAYYYNEVIKEAIPDGKIDEMSEQFRLLVLEEILKAGFVPGMPMVLKEMSQRYPLYIATGSPDDEIKEITAKRNIAEYFQGIYGTPDTKETIINHILASLSCRPEEAVFFGDAESDRLSALHTGVHFVGRIGHGSQMMGETKYTIPDFANISEIEHILRMCAKE